MSIRAIELRRGMGIMMDGQIWVVWNTEHVQKGNKRSYMQVDVRNAKTGQIIGQRLRVDDLVDEVYFDRKPMEYLYSDATGHVLMDTQTYEQVHLPAEIIGDKAVYLTPNLPLEVAMVDGNILSAELPNTVELTVESTPPQVRGATATNQSKEAVCSGGAKIKVPAFIENGQVVKVDTRTGEYLGKV